MSYLTEAFKALDALNEDTFSVSDDGIKKLAEFEDNDDLVDEITVYDADAEDTEDLEDSYVGKVIVDCNVCHSKIYKDKSDVVIDEETQNANIDEECPYCYSTDGFKVIGEVAPMTTETEEKVEVEDNIDESLKESYYSDTVSKILNSKGITSANIVDDWNNKNIEINFDPSDIEDANSAASLDWDKYGLSVKKLSPYNLIIKKTIEDNIDESLKESLTESTVSPNSILDWLRDHEQAWKDFTMYFAGTDLSKLSTSEIVDWISEHDELYSDYERYFNINESLSEATVTDYKGSLSNILVKNQDKISKMSTKGEIVKFLDSITDEVRDKNYLETVKRNMQKKNDFGALQYIYGIILSGEGKGVKEGVSEAFKEDEYMNTYSEDDIVRKVYKIVTEDLDIDYDTIDSSKKGNTVTVTIYAADEEGYEAYEVYTLEDGLSDYLDNKAKVKVSLDDDYNIIIKVTLPKGMLTETLKENIGTDIDEYQQWVDYDMKRYGKISDQTNKEIKEAGLQVVKDKYGDYQVIAGKYDESLKESVKDVTITTDDSRTTMTSDDEGKVTLTTEPVEQHKDDEVIEPLTDETEAEIEANDGEEDIDIEDFDEESFDELGEGYFKNVYENVNSFKASNITTKDNKVIVEGVITFDNNVKKNTSFLFESANKTKNGKYRFIGENLNVTKGNKAFSLIGDVTDKKFLSESMNYNYRTKNDIGKFIRCCGTIKRG